MVEDLVYRTHWALGSTFLAKRGTEGRLSNSGWPIAYVCLVGSFIIIYSFLRAWVFCLDKVFSFYQVLPLSFGDKDGDISWFSTIFIYSFLPKLIGCPHSHYLSFLIACHFLPFCWRFLLPALRITVCYSFHWLFDFSDHSDKLCMQMSQ